MAKPIKYHTLEEFREAMRKRSKLYYENNKELINAKARDKRRREKQAKKLENDKGEK